MSQHPAAGRAESPADRKLCNLLAGDYLLYELTADRQMRVLHLPRRISPPAGCAGRAFPTGGAGATPAR